MKEIIIVAIPFSVLIAMLVTAGIREHEHPCISSHEVMVHHSGWLQFMQSGTTMIPIFHADHDDLEQVCDVRK